MAKVRQLLNPVSVQTAQRPRICHHSRKQHAIATGERCLVIKDPNGGSKNYCLECGGAILDRAGDDLETLRRYLAGA